MSIRINNVVIGGILGRDPEVKTTSNGKPVASFSLAVENGKDNTDWFDVTAWEAQAEVASKFLVKGSVVVILGRLSVNKWVDQKTQENRTKTVIIANSIQFVGGKKKDGGGGAPTISDENIPF
jgi:single-strand DNA-binding protein